MDLGDAYNFAVALGGFDVDDSRPAASLQAVFVGSGAFAVAVFGDGENQSAFFRHQVGYGCLSAATVRWIRLSPGTSAFGVVAIPTR